jgi:membrane protein
MHEFSLNPVVVKDKLFDSAKSFIDEKLDAVRATIEVKISQIVSPAVYYLIIAVLGFCATITILLIAGHFLNRWLDSDYLGYAILLAFFFVVIVFHFIFRETYLKLIRKFLFRFGKEQEV